MSKKIIVAGIDTDTGKTIASAILCEALQADYWKPVQAGDLENSDTKTVKSLVSNNQSFFHPEAYLLNTPMSPHAAADIDGLLIQEEKLTIPETPNSLIIELAGGIMVPLRKDYLSLDWVAKSGLPVVLVSNYYLGSINHSLLSLAVLKARQIPLLGIIFNGLKNPSTYDVIMERSGAKCLLEIEKEEEITPEIISSYARKITLP